MLLRLLSFFNSIENFRFKDPIKVHAGQKPKLGDPNTRIQTRALALLAQALWPSSLTSLGSSFLIYQLARSSHSVELLEVIKEDNADAIHSKQKCILIPWLVQVLLPGGRL